MRVEVEISVEAPGWEAVPGLEALVGRAVNQARQTIAVRLAEDTEVSILLCDDAAIRNLNRDWRGFDKPTNVLSFPASTPAALQERPLLGDIAIAFETVQREAKEEGKSLSDHLSHLVVHGFLHLVGFDHEVEADAVVMESLETQVLGALGIPDPYAGSEPVEKHGP